MLAGLRGNILVELICGENLLILLFKNGTFWCTLYSSAMAGPGENFTLTSSQCACVYMLRVSNRIL